MLTTTDPGLESLFEEVQKVERLLSGSDLLALDRDRIGLLTLQPLVGETLHQLEALSGRSLDGLYRALKAEPLQTTDVLSRVSILVFVGHLLHYKAASRPDQKTRRRVVVSGDDSLLPHSWESGQEGVKVLKDVVSKAYVKAHNMVVVYAVIGDGTICFPLLLQLHNPQNKGVTKVSVLAQAISFLQDRLEAWGLSLEGIDIVFDHWYLKPGVVEAAQNLEMVITTTLAKNEIVRLDNGKNVQLDYYLYHLVQTPIHYDRRLGKLGYYWRFFAVHKLLGRVLIIVRRREKRKGKYYAYDFLVTTDLTAKAITVLRLSATGRPDPKKMESRGLLQGKQAAPGPGQMLLPRLSDDPAFLPTACPDLSDLDALPTKNSSACSKKDHRQAQTTSPATASGILQTGCIAPKPRPICFCSHAIPSNLRRY